MRFFLNNTNILRNLPHVGVSSQHIFVMLSLWKQAIHWRVKGLLYNSTCFGRGYALDLRFDSSVLLKCVGVLKLILSNQEFMIVVFGNRNFGSVSVSKKPNRILFVKPYFTVTAVLYKTVCDNNSYQTYVPSFHSFRS